MNISLAQLRANTERLIRDGTPGIETRTDPHTLLALIKAAQLLATTEDIHFRPEVRQALDELGIEHKGHSA